MVRILILPAQAGDAKPKGECQKSMHKKLKSKTKKLLKQLVRVEPATKDSLDDIATYRVSCNPGDPELGQDTSYGVSTGNAGYYEFQFGPDAMLLSMTYSSP